jgi:hypothetical protein
MIFANPVSSPMIFAPPQVYGLPDDLQVDLNDLVTVWARKRPRNVVRQMYVDSKALVKNLDISVSQEIADLLEITSGWPEKAVYGLANLCQWDGVVSPDGVDDPFDMESLLHANRFDVELPQTIASEMTHSVAFISTIPGDVQSGEPPVVIMPHSAEWASAIWDRVTRSLRVALTINDVDDLGRPTILTILTPFQIIVCMTRGSGWFMADVRDHALGRVPMEALPFRPTLDRPFGRSRVSRSVMNITDRAVRAALRMDVSSEIFTVPGLLLRGIDKDAWDEISKSWSWRLGAVKGVSRDENGEVPEVTTLPQQSMQPFTEQMRELAAEFSGATSIPINQLGIVQDNPSSAEAIYAAKEELVIEATSANRVNGYALNRIYQNVVMLRDGMTEVSDELSRLSTRWRNPAMPSVVSQSDAMVKQISAIPGLADTDVALEEMGYSDEQIKRIRAQIKAAQGGDLLDRAMGRVQQSQEVTTGGVSGADGGVSSGE